MVEIIVAFVVSVLAGIVSYYICKWLDKMCIRDRPSGACH